MTERIMVFEDQKVIKVDSFGDVSFEGLRKSLYEVVNFHQEYGFTKVLVDALKATSFPSTIPVFEFGSELAQVVPKLKIATVTPIKNKDIAKFLENVTQNRGAQVQIFNSEDAAMEWLMK